MGEAAGEHEVVVDDVSYVYPRAESPALEGVSLRVAPRERLGILGPNGGGKSTLLKLILGLLPVQRGRVEVCGRSPARARREGLIGYVAQRAETTLGLPISVRHSVELAATWRRPWPGAAPSTRAFVEQTLELVGAADYAGKPVGALSGGQLQRALIARALCARPRVLALDEPTVGIDAAGQQRFAELLERIHRERGVTVLVVSHDLRAIAAGCDRVACLARRLHSHTSPQGLTPQVLAELFTHDLAFIPSASGAVHVHAHAAAQCTDHGPVSLTVGAASTGRAGDGGPGGGAGARSGGGGAGSGGERRAGEGGGPRADA